MCTLQWLLSDHQHVCLSYSQEDIKQQLKKNSNGRSPQLNQYLSYKLHSSFKRAWIFSKILTNSGPSPPPPPGETLFRQKLFFPNFCEKPFLAFFFLGPLNPEMPFSELIFAKNLPGEDPRTPICGMGSPPAPATYSTSRASHHFALSCPT